MKKILNILMAALVLTGISCSEDLEYKPGGVTPVQTLLLPADNYYVELQSRKGKTTAAMGLALRALGSGKRVVIVQFLKGGNSGEIPLLAQLGAEIYRGKAGQKFVFQMTPEEKAATRELQNQNLAAAIAQPADLLILDEAGSAEELDMVDVDLLKKAVLERPAGCECVLTAHTPPQWMLDAADYSTEMKCRRHPYQKGIKARKGIEY